jgi:hypothetical protein
MICSVYDSARRIYTYYECPGSARDNGVTGTKFRKPNRPPELSPGLGANATIGFCPDALALVLPPGATPIGTGTRPKGVIAVRAGGDPLKAFMADKGGSGPALRGALAGLGTVGDTITLPTDPPTEIDVKPNLGQVVFAACVASVVGAIVQRVLR